MMGCARLRVIEMQNALQPRRRFERAFCINLDPIRFEIPRLCDALRGDAFAATGIEQTTSLCRWKNKARDPFGHALGCRKEAGFRG
jgi:hypothetical protein